VVTRVCCLVQGYCHLSHPYEKHVAMNLGNSPDYNLSGVPQGVTVSQCSISTGLMLLNQHSSA
jgi:hypothetical protein